MPIPQELYAVYQVWFLITSMCKLCDCNAAEMSFALEKEYQCESGAEECRDYCDGSNNYYQHFSIVLHFNQ